MNSSGRFAAANTAYCTRRATKSHGGTVEHRRAGNRQVTLRGDTPKPGERGIRCQMSKRLVYHYRHIARILAWVGGLLIIILSVVPASDRPVTGMGQSFEHLTAFGLVAGMFAIGYQLSLVRRFLITFLFCGGLELLQVPLPTRHARISDFIIDLIASWAAIAVVRSCELVFDRN
jgi:hypothetical protein